MRRRFGAQACTSPAPGCPSGGCSRSGQRGASSRRTGSSPGFRPWCGPASGGSDPMMKSTYAKASLRACPHPSWWTPFTAFRRPGRVRRTALSKPSPRRTFEAGSSSKARNPDGPGSRRFALHSRQATPRRCLYPLQADWRTLIHAPDRRPPPRGIAGSSTPRRRDAEGYQGRRRSAGGGPRCWRAGHGGSGSPMGTSRGATPNSRGKSAGATGSASGTASAARCCSLPPIQIPQALT